MIRAGLCPDCGIKTHKKKFFGMKLAPLTDRYVYDGTCLRCNPIGGIVRYGRCGDKDETEPDTELFCALMAALCANDGDDDWPCNIRKGSHVRCTGTDCGAGGVSIGDIGIVRARDSDGHYKVDYPRQDGWIGRPTDIVLDDSAEKIERGALVRFKPGMTAPVLGDLSKNNDEFDTFSKSGLTAFVADVRHDGIAALNFGQNDEGPFTTALFVCALQDLEPVDPCNIIHIWPAWPGCPNRFRH